jgi:hypothetical protein
MDGITHQTVTKGVSSYFVNIAKKANTLAFSSQVSAKGTQILPKRTYLYQGCF